jgi:acyl transferase domain-containing protein
VSGGITVPFAAIGALADDDSCWIYDHRTDGHVSGIACVMCQLDRARHEGVVIECHRASLSAACH